MPLDLVAIDGPAGSGKSTVAREAARRLGRFHLDTGALYRAVTWKALAAKADLDDGAALAKLAEESRFELRDGRLFLDGADRSAEIRTPEVTRAIYRIAEKGEVRTALRPVQRKLVEGRPSVAEGRDMGSVVFPDARWKFFLDASEELRARRRWEEWKAGGKEIPFAQVLAELRDRDAHDRGRAVAPLVCPPDATVIDTTAMAIDQVVDRIVEAVSGAK